MRDPYKSSRKNVLFKTTEVHEINLNKPIFSKIPYGDLFTKMSVSNFRSRCQTLRDAFQRCPACTLAEATDQALFLNLYAGGVCQLTGFRLTTFTFAGSSSKVELILEKLNTAHIDYYSNLWRPHRKSTIDGDGTPLSALPHRHSPRRVT